MPERESWTGLRERRIAEPGAERGVRGGALGVRARGRRCASCGWGGWSQAQLASAAGMTQSAVARFEAGGTVPTLAVLGRIANALNADLTVRVEARPDVA